MISNQEVGDLFNTIDMDRSGTIDFDEFLRHLRVTNYQPCQMLKSKRMADNFTFAKLHVTL